MSLKDCMEYAVSSSTKMRIQRAETGDAQIARRDAVLAVFTPQIDANTYAYYNFGRSIDPQTNTYFNTASFHNNYGVSAGFTLFDGFSAVNNLKIAKTSLAMGRTQEKQVEADICLAVMEAFYNVVYYDSLSHIFTEQVQTATQALTLARKQETLGVKGHADVVQMEADLSDREYDLTNAANQYRDQLLSLQDLMFWPADSVLVLNSDIDKNSMEISADSTSSSSSILSYARENNPAVQLAAGKLSNARAEFNTARWQLLPTLGLYAGWNTSYYNYRGSETSTFRDQFSNNGGEYIELSLSFPIFDRMQRQSRIAKKRNAMEKADAEYEQKVREIDSEVRRAVLDRDGAAAAFRQADHKAEVQQEAYLLNTKKLEQGLISPLEYQTATNNFLKARSDRLNNMFKYLIKRSVARYYAGEEYLNQEY